MENQFCYIKGSFAKTQPNLGTNSDIDLVCSPNVPPEEASEQLLKKYPQLPQDTKLDIEYSAPTPDKVVKYTSCYWQDDNLVELFNAQQLPYKFEGSKLTNTGALLRDPDKSKFKDYFTTSTWLTFKHINNKAIKHYGEDNFMNLMGSLPEPERKLYHKLYSNNWRLAKPCQSSLKHTFMIDRTTKLVTNGVFTLNYDTFMQKCLQQQPTDDASIES
jgi:hypothetical protein